jgi:hypothetical protein
MARAASKGGGESPGGLRMSPYVMQGGTLLLLGLIFVLSVALLAVLMTALKAIRREQDVCNRILAGRDTGPVLHGLLQATKESNKLLHNIDQRLQKLEALEKVQLANWSSQR